MRSSTPRLHRIVFILSLCLVPAEKDILAQDIPVYRSETDLVYLTVTATDRKGRPISGLDASAIRVYEDGVEQEIHHFNQDKVPLTVGLVLDRSGSMYMMIDEVYEAALHVIENLDEGDQAFALTFNSDVRLVHPLTPDLNGVRRSLRGLRADGATALYDAVYEALQYLAQTRERRSDRKVLCVVSDGNDNSSRRSYEELLKKASESDVIIYSVAMTERAGWSPLNLFSGDDVKRLRKLAELSGGISHRPRSVRECEKVMKQISEELSTQYGLGYYPSNLERDGNWREVKVALKDKSRKYAVRTRRGYYAPSESWDVPQ